MQMTLKYTALVHRHLLINYSCACRPLLTTLPAGCHPIGQNRVPMVHISSMTESVATKAWNSLLAEVISARSLETLKSEIRIEDAPFSVSFL